MNRVLKSLALSILAFSVLSASPAFAMGSRVYDSAYRPYRLLAKQYSTNTNVFPTADPSPAGTPLTLNNSMGLASNDGVVTLELGAGFTAPLTLTCYYWQEDGVTPTNAHWTRSGGAAAKYQGTVDTNYASISFSVPPNAPFIVTSSAAVTGNVYCSAPADSHNPGSSVTGY